MWFNLNLIKVYKKNFIEWEQLRFFFFLDKIDQNWSLNNNVKLNLQSYTSWRQILDLLIDSNNYFKVKKKVQLELEFIQKYYNKHWFLIFELLLIPFTYDLLLKNKYMFIKKQNKMLLKQNNILINKKSIYLSKEKTLYIDLFLLLNYFLINDKILLYSYSYIFFFESYIFCFFELYNFLKNFFFNNCKLSVRLLIWEDCNLQVKGSSVYYDKELRWIKNKEIYDNININFFKSISLYVIYRRWAYYYFDNNILLHNFISFLYQKYYWLLHLKNIIIYKVNYLEKKEYIFAKYNKLFLSKNFNNVNFTLKLTSDFLNKNRLINLINLRRQKVKIYIKPLKIFKGNYILNNIKEDNVFIFFYFFFFNYYKKKQKIDLNLLKKKFLKKKFIKKNKINNFNLLFILYFKLKYKINNKLKLNLLKFFSCFYFLIVEHTLLKWNVKKLKKLQELLNKKYFTIKLTKYLFLLLLKLIVKNLEYNIEAIASMRYDLLYNTLFFYYKKYWLILNKMLIKKLLKQEKLLLLNLKNYKFFFKNKIFIKKLYDLYILNNYNYWTLFELKNIIENKLKIYDILFFKKKKINRVDIKYNKYLKKKIFKNSIYINYLQFIVKKLKLYKNINWSIMLYLFNILNKKRILKIYKIMALAINDKRNIPLFLKFKFDIQLSFFYYLEKDVTKENIKKLKKIMYCLYFLYLINKFIFIRKFYKIKNINNIYLLYKTFLKKKIYKKKKIKKYLMLLYKIKKNYILKKNTYNKKLIKQLKKNKYIKKINNKIYNFLKIKNNLYIELNFFIKRYFINDILHYIYEDNIDEQYNNYFNFNNKFDYKYDILFNYLKFILKDIINNIVKDKKIIIKNLPINTLYLLNTILNNFVTIWLLLKNNFMQIYNNINLNKKNILFNIIKKINFLKFKSVLINQKNFFDLLKENYYNNFYYFHNNFHIILYNFFNIFIFYFNVINRLINDELKILNINYTLINRKLIKNNWELLTIDYCLKVFFFKFIWLKKKKKINYFFKNNFKSKYLYINNYLKKKYIFFFKFSLFNVNIDENKFCINCKCLLFDSSVVKLIKYYQKYLKLEKIDKRIQIFNYIFCNKCNCYKLAFNNNPIINFESSKEVLKYFILNKTIKEKYIFFSGDFCYLKILNNCEILSLFKSNIFIQLQLNKYNIEYFYFYFSFYDKNNYSIWNEYWEPNLIFACAFLIANFIDVKIVFKNNKRCNVPILYNYMIFFKELNIRNKILVNKRNYLKRNERKLKYKITGKLKSVINKEAQQKFFNDFVNDTINYDKYYGKITTYDDIIKDWNKLD